MSLLDTRSIRRTAFFAGLLVSTILVVPSVAAASERGTFSPLCAAHDLKSLGAIERAGDLGEIAVSRLAEAGMTFLRGRILCLAGDEAKGIATYEEVVSAITPTERQAIK